jgi:ureidoacrylate peracid hydrolase
MHPIDLPDTVQRLVLKRRGRAFAFETVEPARTALLVIDMQNHFCAEGSGIEIPTARQIVPTINRLAGALRDAGGTVVWVTTAFTDADAASWSVFFDEINAAERAQRTLTELRQGGAGHPLWHELAPADGDLWVSKRRYSAFAPGASDMDERLRALGIDTLWVTGTLTNVCCETSARDAMMANYRVTLVSDANATRTDEEHIGALTTFALSFGDVRPAGDLIALLPDQTAAAAQ